MRTMAWFVAFFSVFVPTLAMADHVHLVNGDSLRGKVISLDDKELKLESELLGKLTIAREKVASIDFMGGKDTSPEAKPDAPLFDPYGLPAAKSAPKTGAKAKPNTNDDLVEQLRQLDPANIGAVEKAFPLLNTSPEAKKYFTDRVGGLISGDINIEDVRNDAKKVVTELEDLKKDLGPQAGQALDGYLGILNRFLRETDPEKADKMKIKEGEKIPADKLKLESPAELEEKLRKLDAEIKK